MADENKYTDEELNLIEDLISPLSGDMTDEIFSPMSAQFNQDMVGFRRPTEKEAETPESISEIEGMPGFEEAQAGGAETMEPEELAQPDFGGLDELGEAEPETGWVEEPSEPDFGGLDELGLAEPETGGLEEPGEPDFGGLDELGVAEPETGGLEEPSEPDFGGLDELGAAEPETGGMEEPSEPDFGGLDELGAAEPETGGLEEPSEPDFAKVEEAAPELETDFGGLEDLTVPEELGAEGFDEEAPGIPEEIEEFSAADINEFLPVETSLKQVEAGPVPPGRELGEFLDTSDLSDMSRQADLNQGIGDEFTDEELAKIRSHLQDYPPALKRSVIEAIVGEKLTHPDQRLLMNMVIDQANHTLIADFLTPRLGYRPDLTPSTVRKDGVQIIYADGLSPEELRSKRRHSIILAAMVGAALAGIFLLFGGYRLYDRLSIQGLYDEGLDRLTLAAKTRGSERESLKSEAMNFYDRALEKEEGKFNLEYLNRYGIALMKAGYNEEAFIKLFGKVEPDYTWNDPSLNVPLVRFSEDSRWLEASERAGGMEMHILARDNVIRKVLVPGAFLVSRLRDNNTDRTTILNLARFHSQNAKGFINGLDGQKYKNDLLAIDYYRLILTLLNKPDDVEAMAGTGNIHYNRKDFVAAAREFNNLLDRAPLAVEGNAGLINTYIEIWKRDGDPRFVIARHRFAQSTGIEEKLPIYTLVKLAGFYIDIDPDDLRIKYQVDPVNLMTEMDIDDNTTHLLELVFNMTEQRDEETIEGSTYGEGFYQRGRFLMKQKESLRALKQFQNAHQYSPVHYLAVSAMGEYYMDQLEFDKAAEYFKTSIEIYNDSIDEMGSRPEDEPLIEGDIGKVYYNLGSLAFLRYAGYEAGEGFQGTRIYPDRSRIAESEELENRREQLRIALGYFDRALENNIKDERSRINSIYWAGWIDYISGDFTGASRRWDTLDAIYAEAYSDPVLLIARGNAAYYSDQYRIALGNFLKVLDDYEREAMKITTPNPSEKRHREVFYTLAALYNNIGAVYEQELREARLTAARKKRIEQESLKYYWKAVEFSRKIEMDNEIARTNIQRGFSEDPALEPLLDDWVSPELKFTDEER